jgi:hypothetical protein
MYSEKSIPRRGASYLPEQYMEKRRRDWRELCEAASKENDPKRLLVLVKELNEVLGETQNGRSIYWRDPRLKAQVPSTLQDFHPSIASALGNRAGAQRE